MRTRIATSKAYRLLNHGPTTLITSAANGARNVMAAAWVMPLDFEPARVAAVIATGTQTRTLVDASGEFVVNVPTRAMVDAVHIAGSVSGRDVDKFESAHFATTAAESVGAPLLDGCVAWLECRVRREPAIESAYDLFIADVVTAWAEDEVFRDGKWDFTNPARRSLHHVAGGDFFATGMPVRANRPGAVDDDPLEAARTALDAIDRELVSLLAARLDVVDGLFTWKDAQGLPRVDPLRENAVLDSRIGFGRAAGVPDEMVARMMTAILDDARRPR